MAGEPSPLGAAAGAPFRPAPLEGPAVSLVARLRPDADRAQAEAELAVITARTASTSPDTHRNLRPGVTRYGGQTPVASFLGTALTHLPIALVLLIACVNVGTLVYARIATREAEIATRYAIGASRGRIIGQLFMEALALALLAGALGLAAADRAPTWGVAAIYEGQTSGPPSGWSRA